MGLKFSYLDTELTTSKCDSLLALGRSGSTIGDAYGLLIDVSNVLEGAGATGPRSWGVGILGNKEAGAVITAGADDALLRLSGNNYVANGTSATAVFNFRGLNAAIANRSGGCVAQLNHTFGVQGKSGGTVRTLQGLQITAENYGTVADEFGGLRLDLRNEAAVATVEYGIFITNTNNSIAGPVDAVLKVSKTGANTGFTNLLYVPTAGDLGIAALSGDVTFSSSGIKIPIKVGSTTYYIAAQPSI